MIASPRKLLKRTSPFHFPVDVATDNMQVHGKRVLSETDSLAGESDTSTVSSSHVTTQQVFRWSKFVRNLYEMTINSENAKAVGFSADGLCIEIRDTKLLSTDVLQKYFKHNNVSSFIRQLNNYGFKTIPLVMNSSVVHCFAHDCFRKGRTDLLEGVVRRNGGNGGSEATRANEKWMAMKEKERDIATRMTQLQHMNEHLKRHNMELAEENKRLKSQWLAMQDTMKLQQQQPPHQQLYEHHRRQYPMESFPSFPSAEIGSEVFINIPGLFPEDF